MSRTSVRLRAKVIRLAALALVLGMALFGAQLVFAAPPDVNFSVTPAVPLPGQEATFTAIHLKTGDFVSWDFDDDGIFDAQGRTVGHVFTTPGQQPVLMRVTSAGGEVKDVRKTVRVDTPPTASFSASPNPATVGDPVQFDAGASSDPDGTIVGYEWDLDGNGSFETATGGTPTASKSYADPGTVNVKVRVTDNDGATAETTVAVVVDNRRPVASFTASPNPALVGESVQFDASASLDPDGTIAGYEWDLDDDGQFDDATGVSTSRSFAAAGTYTVRLLVTDDRGATDTVTLAVTINSSTPSNQSPIASFTASPNPAMTGQTVQFDAGASADPDGTIVGYEWDLDGNGSFETATGSTPTTSRAYSVDGTVNVKVRVTDNGGATAEKTVAVVVSNRAPVASFTASPNPALVGQSVQFDASASLDPDGTIAGYEWDLDDDGQFDDATGVSTSRSFAAAGTYTVRLSVTDNRGAKDTATVAVIVNNLPPPPLPNQPPVASFTALPNPAMTGQTVQFDAGASSDPDGTIVGYEWDLDGNGSFETATGSTPTTSRAYSVDGTVNVKVRVTDNGGATAEKTVAVVVSNRAPVASFTASPNPALVGQSVQFDASASLDPDGTIAGYEWDLDDDGQFDDASGVTTTRSFAAAGTYTVRLSVTDNRGAKDTATVAVIVNNLPPPPLPNQPPVASFTALPNPAMTGQTVQFDAGASSDPDGTIVGYEWDLDGNGSFETATGSTPTTSRAYSVDGTVNVKVRVTDNGGATAEKTVAVVVSNRAPVASFTASPNPALVGQSVQFDASASLDPDGTIAGYEWDLDDDGQFDDASGVTTTRSFAAAGTYTVRLSVTDNRGGKDTGTLAVTVNDAPAAPPANRAPVASFTLFPSLPMVGNTVYFNSTSSDPEGALVSHAWDLDGDGQFDDSSSRVAAVQFGNPGLYVVSLRVTDAKGAADVETQTIIVGARLASALPGLELMSPFPVVRLVARLTRRGANVKLLAVRGVPRGAKVTVRCRGGGCRIRERSKSVASGRVRFRSFERRLRAGVSLQVLITQPGKIGKYTSFKIRRSRAPVRRDLCVVDVASKPGVCRS